MPASLRLILLCSAAWIATGCARDGDGGVGPPPPPDPVASVEVTPSSVELPIGASAQLSATTKAADGSLLTGRSVAWSTSAPAVATIDGNGLLSAIAAGEATITATSEGKSGTSAVRVTTISIASVEIVPNPASVAVGQSAQLAAVVLTEDGSELPGAPVIWSTSDPAIATVNETGLVAGVVQGQATITGAAGGKTGSTVLTVSAVPVASLEVTPQSSNLVVGSTVQLSATARDQAGSILAGRPATWATSDANVARVNSTGRVTAIAAGTATITATIEGKTGTATIAVTQQPVATVEVRPNPASVAVQQTLQLTVTLKAADGSTLTGRDVTWESTNQSVATVSPTGLVQGVAPGSATIRARSEGKNGTTALTVTQTQQPVATVTVSPNNGNQVAVQGTLQFTAALKAADGTVLTGRSVTWSSSNDAVARVNADGLATGIAPGSVTITATSEGKTGTASLTVMPVSGITRTWRGGASGRPSDWSTPANWTPTGKPIPLDTVRVPATANPAVLSEDAQIARLLISGGKLRLAGHRLRVLASPGAATLTAANSRRNQK